MLQIFRETIGRWVAIAILGLIAVTFVFFGIDFNLTGTTFAARVNGEEVPIAEFNRELQATQNQYQQLYRTELNDDLRRQLRRSVVERMVSAEAMRQRVDELGYRVSNERLADYIQSIDAFLVGGQFSMDVYRALLSNQGLSIAGFEALQRDQIALQDLQDGLAASSFVAPSELRRYIELNQERRDIAYVLFPVEDFVGGVEISEDEIAAYYDDNAPLYMSEESVDFEYVEVDLASIADGMDVSEDELRGYYEDNLDQFETQEERNASHILFTFAQGERDAAEARAREALERLRAGESFAELAAEYSDDPGTANAGGDLGWIARGTLEGPFEDALYSLEVGEVSEPVETDFGLHLIRLDELREGDVESFESLRDELLTELSTGRAEDRFYARANELADHAFDAYDELASVAAEMDLPLERVTGFTRSGDGDRFDNRAAVVQAAFDAELRTAGINSDLIELTEDHVLVLRVTGYHPPEQRPLDEVRDEIRAELERERASELAADALDAYMDAVAAGGDDAEAAEMHGGRWVEPGWVRRDGGDAPAALLSVAFSLPRPAEGAQLREPVPLPSGDEAVLILRGVEPGRPDELSADEREQLRNQLRQQMAQAEIAAYAEAVRAAADVRIPEQVLEPQF